jgi:uncharacterized protein YndB with AHSA1/START domain
MKTIRKSMEISAPKEKVWVVLLEDKYNRDWYALFSEGTYAKTDWIEGHKVMFLNNSNNGIVGRIIKKRPYEELVMEYDGLVMNGVEDYDSEFAKKTKGIRESYTLSDHNGGTLLAISCDMDDEHFEMMSRAWESALQRISELAHAAQV